MQSTTDLGPGELIDLACILAGLCAGAYQLPGDPIDDDGSLPTLDSSLLAQIASELAAKLPQDHYRSIDPLDVYSDSAPTTGQLSDDLADIWAELEIGLRSWRRGGHEVVGHDPLGLAIASSRRA